jgi:hypothetical protein
MATSIALRLAATQHEHDVVIHSSVGFKIGDNGVWENRRLKVRLLEFRNRYWRTEDQVFSSFTVDGPVRVQFENHHHRTSLAPFNPFEQVFVASGGSAFGDREFIAKYLARTSLWRVLKAGTYWPYLIVKPVAS